MYIRIKNYSIDFSTVIWNIFQFNKLKKEYLNSLYLLTYKSYDICEINKIIKFLIFIFAIMY